MEEEKKLYEGKQEVEVFDVSNGDMALKKKKPVVLIVLIALFLIAGVIGFFSYKHLTQNPTEIIKKIVNKSYEDFSKALKKNDKKNYKFDMLEETVHMSGYLKFVDNNFSGLDKEKVTFELGLDYKDKYALLGVGLSDESMTIGDAKLNFQNDKMLFSSGTMFDNVYDLGEYKFDEMFDFSDFEDVSFDYKTDDIDFIVRELKDALLEALDEDEMTISKEKISVDGKSISTNKISYKVSNETMLELKKNISNYVLNDDELIEKIAKFTHLSVKEVRESFKDFKTKTITGDLDGLLSIYTTGFHYDVVMIEFDDGDEKCHFLDYADKIEFLYDDGDVDFQIEGVRDGEELILDVTYDSEEVASFTIRDWEDDIDLDYEINVEGVNLNGSLTIEVEDIDEKSYSVNIIMSMKGEIGKEKLDYDVEIDYDFTIGKELDKADAKKALTEFTLGDTEKLMDKLEEIQETAIFEYFTKKLGNLSGLV